MTRPLDRLCMLPALGKIDREAGEFWVPNPFMMPSLGKNLSAFERNRLFLNMGGTDFIDGSFGSEADIDSDSRSVVAADFDRDGRPDLLVGSVGGETLRLFRNRLPQTNRLQLSLTGTKSNRSAIGTRIVLQCGQQTIVRDLFPHNGFMGQAPAELLVGVGAAKRIDRLTVRWPAGKTQTFHDVPVNKRISITEGSKRCQIELK